MDGDYTKTLQTSTNLSLSVYKSPKGQRRQDFWLPKPNPTGSRLSKNDSFSKFGSRTQKLWNARNVILFIKIFNKMNLARENGQCCREASILCSKGIQQLPWCYCSIIVIGDQIKFWDPNKIRIRIQLDNFSLR